MKNIIFAISAIALAAAASSADARLATNGVSATAMSKDAAHTAVTGHAARAVTLRSGRHVALR